MKSKAQAKTEAMHNQRTLTICGHIDGYDKFKAFDFCIHGAIDGY